jgi:enamine deaminase RidA (YjgF/YER057c/UK114 family)
MQQSNHRTRVTCESLWHYSIGAEVSVSERKRVNPWTWQDQYGFSQAIDVRDGNRVLYCAGQTSVDDQGNVLHAGDMAAQIGQALDNLEVVLRDAGLSLGHVVRLNYYTTDVPAFFGAAETLGRRLQAAGIQPAGTLLGIASLFHPDALIEIEATAVE